MSRSPFDVQGSADVHVGDFADRAESASSSGVRPAIRAARNPDESGPRAAQASSVLAAPESERTVESHRAEAARLARGSGPRKLAKALPEFARGLNALMAEFRMRYGDAYSNGAVARDVGVDEKIVRQWRNGEKEPRATQIALFPARLREEVFALCRDLAGRAPEPWIVQLGRTVDAPNARVTEEDAPAIDLVIGRLGEMRRKATGGG